MNPAENAEPQPYTKKRHYWRWAALVLITVVGYLIWRQLRAPAQGVIIKSTAQQYKPHASSSGEGQYDGKYVSFHYPASYQPVKPDPSGYLEQAQWVGGQGSSALLSLTVQPLGTDTDPNIKQRQAHPETYTSKTVTVGGETGLLFQKRSAFEQTLFIQHQQKLISLSLTDPNGNDLSSQFEEITGSLTFH